MLMSYMEFLNNKQVSLSQVKEKGRQPIDQSHLSLSLPSAAAASLAAGTSVPLTTGPGAGSVSWHNNTCFSCGFCTQALTFSAF